MVHAKQKMVDESLRKELMYKGIILAGGSGTRLYPITKGTNKQLLPLYNKPMVYYPISILMRAGIRDFLIISSPEHLNSFMDLFEDGSKLGINVCYKEQERPAGIAEAFLLGEEFIGQSKVALILGDNIFYGDIIDPMKRAMKKDGATIFAYHVKNPEDYGVVSFYEDGTPLMIQEKPKKPSSHYAVTGLYLYDNDVVQIAKSISPSARGELEITDINNAYLDLAKLHVERLPRGTAWLDTGTHDNLMLAAQFIEVIEKRTGLMIGSLEEIAYRQGYIDQEDLIELAEQYKKSDYGKYLIELATVNHAY